MDSRAQENPEQEAQVEDVNESVGMSDGQTEERGDSHETDHEGSHSSKKRPSGWERLKAKNREYERDINDLHERMSQMQAMMPGQSQQQQPMDNQMGQPSGIDEQIHKAVSYALQHREREEEKARQAQQAMHVHKQYEGLHNHLDRMSDKYDDFDDVVRGKDVPITTSMRDASLLLPQEGPGSAGEVLYQLGKNKSELERISKLHPLEQARELNKLSRSLEIGGNKGLTAPPQKTLGNIKSNPVGNSHTVTDKTSVSDLRQKMRAGGKRWY